MENLFSLPRRAAGVLPGHLRQRSWLRLSAFLGLLWGLLAAPAAFALQGNDNCHDPSTIIKEGNKYWVFTTGTDIYAMYSTDLVNWQSGARSVFNGVQPSWIAGRVPGFDRTQDTYWAPECVYRNGKYYLYYSCSKFGTNTSAIGLATNVTLDPASPNYQWQDQGEVVSTSSSSAENAIDPGIITDASGKVWMTYGSFFKGIKLIQLDPSTGKRLGTSSYWLAGNVGSDNVTRGASGSEAPYIVRNGAYYYLFLNKGACCKGSSSTYYVVVGRSSSVTGPYVDRNGVDLNKNGGTTLIATKGNYVGPGCVGLFIENGVNYLTHHYYDSNQNGRARLSVGNLGWDGSAWPFITRDWLAAGRYTLTNQSSKLVWDAWGCTGASGQMIAQGTPAGRTCQQWDLTPDGNGEYKITNALGGLSADVVNNSPANGARLQLYAYSGVGGQRFKIERTNANTFVLASVNGNRVVEVPACSATAGTQLALYDYLGNACQQWGIAAGGGATARTAAPAPATSAVAPAPEADLPLRVYPNPAAQGHFVVHLGAALAAAPATLTLTNGLGRQVYTRTSTGQPDLPVAALAAGLYLVRVHGAAGTFTQKVLVQ
jgi:arabinan endo-1,5-alpha-L-arabinosidase